MTDTAEQEAHHRHLCLWFKVSSGSGGSAVGECRRYAPRPYPVLDLGNVSGTTDATDTATWDTANWRWPECYGSWFCGDSSGLVVGRKVR